MKLTPLFVLALASLAGCSADAATEADVAGDELAIGSAPIALDGTYYFEGEVKPLGRLTVDVVDMRMSDAADRLADLRSSGANCALVISQTYRCTKMHGASAVADASLEAIAARSAGLSVTFGARTGSPSLVTDADSLTEWQIPQNGTGLAGSFDRYTYRQLRNGPTKIVLPGAGDLGDELLVEDASRITKWERKVVTEGRWRWHEDMAVAVLAR
ncbi:MAG: hypothetical protein KIT84_02140 [Labilithrix sp.]|nr:hypothetical protein [Labilithrix sp.]MCW5809789.1 hypothetical protein [Labilithrix sp.]